MRASGSPRCSSSRTISSPRRAVAAQFTRRSGSPYRYSRAMSSSEFGCVRRCRPCTTPSMDAALPSAASSAVTRGVTTISCPVPTSRSIRARPNGSVMPMCRGPIDATPRRGIRSRYSRRTVSSPDGSTPSYGPIAGRIASGGPLSPSGTVSRQCAPSKVRRPRFFTTSETRVQPPAGTTGGAKARVTARRGVRTTTNTAAAAGIAMPTKASSRMSRRSNQSDTARSSTPTITSVPPRLVSRGQAETRTERGRDILSSFVRCRPEPASPLRCGARWRR